MRYLVEQLHSETYDPPDVSLLELKGKLPLPQIPIQHRREYSFQRYLLERREEEHIEVTCKTKRELRL